MFFDTHIHLTDFRDISPDDLILRLKENDIKKCVCVSATPSDWEKTAQFARNFPSVVIPAFGLHPWYINKSPANLQQTLEKYLLQFENATVGECGFDRLKNTDLSAQQKIFDIHLALAKKYDRPLILHAVKADGIMQQYDSLLPSKTVFHSFTGSLERLKQINKFGFFISLNLKSLHKKNAIEIVCKIPKERLLIETDAPYQSMPSDLRSVSQKIADLRVDSVENVENFVYKNAMEVFIK